MRHRVIHSEGQLAEDTGFGKKFSGANRLVNGDGSFNIERIGSMASNLYEKAINSSWSIFFFNTFLFFLIINGFFAIIYFFNGIENLNYASKGGLQDFANCLYFSIQTFTSVGYGFLNPQNNIANITASLNALVGLLAFALATGMLFARFSKANVSIEFSKNMLISELNGKKTLQLRMVNVNNNTLINMEASVTMTWLEDVGDTKRRRFQRLPLELDFIYLFPMNWTLVHHINEESPLHKMTREALEARCSEFLIMVRGYDDTYNQFIYKNHSYYFDSLVENAIFTPMYTSGEDKTVLYIEKLSDYEQK